MSSVLAYVLCIWLGGVIGMTVGFTLHAMLAANKPRRIRMVPTLNWN